MGHAPVLTTAPTTALMVKHELIARRGGPGHAVHAGPLEYLNLCQPLSAASLAGRGSPQALESQWAITGHRTEGYFATRGYVDCRLLATTANPNPKPGS